MIQQLQLSWVKNKWLLSTFIHLTIINQKEHTQCCCFWGGPVKLLSNLLWIDVSHPPWDAVLQKVSHTSAGSPEPGKSSSHSTRLIINSDLLHLSSRVNIGVHSQTVGGRLTTDTRSEHHNNWIHIRTPPFSCNYNVQM